MRGVDCGGASSPLAYKFSPRLTLALRKLPAIPFHGVAPLSSIRVFFTNEAIFRLSVGTTLWHSAEVTDLDSLCQEILLFDPERPEGSEG